MPQFTYTQTVSPSGTAYDGDFPTRSTELFSSESHRILESMGAAGFKFSDDLVNDTFAIDAFIINLTTMHQNTSLYIAAAIASARLDPPIPPAFPTKVEIPYFISTGWAILDKQLMAEYCRCFFLGCLVCHLAQVTDDPTALEHLADKILAAWPTIDTEIELGDETGNVLRIFPAWNNID